MEITSVELEQKIKNGEKVLVDFFTNWCAPCKVMKPMFEEASKRLIDENSEIKLYTMNIEKNTDYAIDVLRIKNVPTIKGFFGGKEVYHSTGILKTGQIIQVAKKL